MHLIFGEMALTWEIQVFTDYPNFLFAILPPGAFVGMGLIIAFKNIIDQRIEASKSKEKTTNTTSNKRVRVTGNVA
jgi:electron transport complex protein RnfE